MALSKAIRPDPDPDLFAVGSALLDEVYTCFMDGRIHEGMPLLIAGLSELREQLTEGRWTQYCEGVCRQHPLMPLLHQDLFTNRAFTKPRGYPGDAVMLDYVYAADDPGWPNDPSFTAVGREVNRQLNLHPTVVAVRERKRFMTRIIDEVADRAPGAHVFSVAAGHAREAGATRALAAGRLGRLLTLDHDPVSLQVIQQDLAPLGVETLCASVVDLVRGPLQVGEFDLIYSMGLYDYLRHGIAERLTRALFERLRPGGRLLLANFQPEAEGAGYMEAFMDWWLIHRTADDLLALAENIPAERLHSVRTIHDSFHTVITLELIKAG